MKTNIALLAALLLAPPVALQAADLKNPNGEPGSGLAAGFVNPPPSARAQTWWHWMNGNITKEGITADLEAMARVGVGGAQIFNAGPSLKDCWDTTTDTPHGPVQFNSPEWRALVKHAAQECERLGLELCVHNCAGWSSSGGPWIKPEQGMQVVVSSETPVRGGARYEGVLPKPQKIPDLWYGHKVAPALLDYYRDIAVLAFRTPAAEAATMRDVAVKVTSSAGQGNPSLLVDGKPNTFLSFPLPAKLAPQFVVFEFARPWTARSLAILPMGDIPQCEARLEVSDDGGTYKPVKDLSLHAGNKKKTFTFAPVTARFFRLQLLSSQKTWRKDIPLAEVELLPSLGIEGFPAKVFQIRGQSDAASGDALPASPDTVVAGDQIVDLSSRMAADGKLSWDVPAGSWTIVRFGYAPNGSRNHPGPEEGTGLESDKLSREATIAHWEGAMAPLIKDMGTLAGKAFNGVHIDSYEVGLQNWTPKFRGEFQKRRGYDCARFLPTLTGRVVDSPEITERFLWDFRRMIADLFAENYSAVFAELAHKNHLLYSVEPYGNSPTDNLQYGSYADIPMSEGGLAPFAAALGHVYGRKVVGHETFTAPPEEDKWLKDPYSLKAPGDLIWCGGVNRFIFHCYAHQSWTAPTRFPGMTMGQWGTHLERTQTWWEQSRAWLTYIARSQYMLQSGRFCGDVLVFVGEDAPNGGMTSPPAIGYSHDTISADGLLNLASVKDGRIVLPSGMSYRVLALADSRTMTPALLRKLKQLAGAGATIVGKKPERSPSLSGYPECDAEVKTLVAELWPGSIKDQQPAAALAALGVPPDFQAADTAGRNRGGVAWIHRVAEGADLYFVSNQKQASEEIRCTFRVAGKQPELWHPDTGVMEDAPVFTEKGGRTTVPLRFGPAGSVFVVFRHPAAKHWVEAKFTPASPDNTVASLPGGQPAVSAWQPGAAELTDDAGKAVKLEIQDVPAPVAITGPWELSFPPNWGAPASVKLDTLISWTEHPDPGVKYFSGTATYKKAFLFRGLLPAKDRAYWLDLGDLKNIAEVKLNGKDLGILWKPPFRVDVTDALRDGSNELDIRVTNLWPNRLIGDEQLPEDREWDGLHLKAWPQWLLDGKPSPTGRFTFTTWHHWKKDDALLPSGLFGPVTLRTEVRVPAQP